MSDGNLFQSQRVHADARGKYAAGFWGLMQFVYLAENERIERREQGFFQNPVPGFLFASGEV